MIHAEARPAQLPRGELQAVRPEGRSEKTKTSAKRQALRLQAQAQRGRIAASDHGRGDTCLLQQLQAMPVQGVEALERFAGFAEIQAAIGQHPVHIEKGHAHALGLQQQHGIEAERRAAVGC